MSVARLCRSRCEPTYFCGGLRPVRSNASLSAELRICESAKGRYGTLLENNDVRDGCRKIALGLPAPEQKAEQVAQMGRRRFIPRRLAIAAELAQEVDDI